MKITDAEVDRAAYVFWDAMLRISPREAMRAALEAALTHPCTCREDVACGACMSGATDPATAQTTPTADVREEMIDVLKGAGYDEDRQADAILAAFNVTPQRKAQR